MELGLLKLMPAAGSPDDAGLAPGRIGDGDAFTQLLAQLGLAPTAEAIPTTPEALAVALAKQVSGKLAPAAQPATEDGGGETPVAEADTESSAASADGPTLDPATLGLPPLIAALFAPAAAPATEPPAAVPAALIAQPLPASATPALSAAVGAALVNTIPDAPQATMPEGVAPGATAVAKTPPADLAVEARTPLAMPLPQAAAAAVELPRHLRTVQPAPVTADSAPAPAAEKPAVAAVDLTSLVTVKAAPLPLTPLAPVSIDAAPQPAMPAAEAPPALDMPIEPHLDLARDGEWLDQLARDIARTASADGQLRFKLNPEHLGSLHVELRSGASGASVRLTADTEAARSIIADARPQLIAEARAQGVRITEAHVDLGSNGQSPGGGHPRDGRELPPRTYLTSWKPDSVEEGPTPPRRSASERYA